MQTSGFTNAPVSRLLMVWIVVASMLVTLTDTKMFTYIQVVPHFWEYFQWWRVFTWQLTYASSTSVLFSVLTIYNLRLIERLWGSRKFLSFLLLCAPYTALLPPLLLTFVFRPLSFNSFNYLPAGPTAIVFALLAQYHAAVPATYRYKMATTAGGSDQTGRASSGSAWRGVEITVTNKWTSYFLPLQLALSELPGSAIAAGVGWVVGYAWRNDVLPKSSWRVPGWLVGEDTSRGVAGSRTGDEGFEGLRRRLEGEATASGADTQAQPDEGRRRTMGGVLAEQFGHR